METVDNNLLLRLTVALESLTKEIKKMNDLKEKEMGGWSRDIARITEEFVEGDKPPVLFSVPKNQD